MRGSVSHSLYRATFADDADSCKSAATKSRKRQKRSCVMGINPETREYFKAKERRGVNRSMRYALSGLRHTALIEFAQLCRPDKRSRRIRHKQRARCLRPTAFIHGRLTGEKQAADPRPAVSWYLRLARQPQTGDIIFQIPAMVKVKRSNWRPIPIIATPVCW